MPPQRITATTGSAGAEALAAVGRALAEGALVVLPTETVYGVAAAAGSPSAMQRLRALKGRPPGTPFSVHTSKPSDAAAYVNQVAPVVRRLSRRIWPGPLTMILEGIRAAETEAGQRLPAETQNEIFFGDTVSLRCPDHAATSDVLAAAGGPVLITSAARSNEPPTYSADEAAAAINDSAEWVVDGGPARYRNTSTIVRIRGHAIAVEREGVIDERTVRRLARSAILFVCTGNSCRSPLAEYLFRHKLMEKLGLSADALEAAGYHVSSAGTFAPVGGGASKGTTVELQNRGLDAGGHRSRPLTVELVQAAERIYCMSPEHRRLVLDLAPAATDKVALLDAEHPVSDPMGGSQEDYARAARQIEVAVDKRLEEFLNEDRDW